MSARQPERRICVLGAGIMGCSLASFLARRGARVTLIDQKSAPVAGASRWNEGKIHLGYLYSGDPSLATARRVLEGGLLFGGLVEELTGCKLANATTEQADLFLTHRNSVVGVDAMRAYFTQVSDLVRSNPAAGRYLVDAHDARTIALSKRELEAVSTSSDIVAGFRVPERSVRTSWVADRLAAAVQAEPRIEFMPGKHVLRAEASGTGWRIVSDPATSGRFHAVVNALWHGQAALDSASGFASPAALSYRYRLSLFVNTRQPVELPSAVIATGPFGDVKNYNGRDFYLSWYPAGLIADLTEPATAFEPELDAAVVERVVNGTVDGLTAFLPGVAAVVADAAEIVVRGGWVVAPGRGSLSDPASPLHRRDSFGVSRHGGYVSVDTGKYSTAPWLARRIADEIMA